MTLGNYIEVRVNVPDVAEAVQFYEKLGFKKLADDVVTDNCFNMRLVKGEPSTPDLIYYGGKEAKTLNSPNEVTIHIKTETTDLPMPEGTARDRKPISELGKMGEFSIPVDDFEAALKFWEQQGYTALIKETQPYPWGIVTDEMFVVGLHQNKHFDIEGEHDISVTNKRITFFSGDMADRIAKLKQKGLEISDLSENDPPEHAQMKAPGGQFVFLFQGEV